MRIYSSCKEAVREVERDLYELGVDVQVQTMQDKVVGDDENYKTRELSPCTFTLTNYAYADKKFFLEYFKIPQEWAEAEFAERVSALWHNPGEAWKLRRDLWEEFLHEGTFAYTYNERFRTQLYKVKTELQERPGSRQVILSMYSNEQDGDNWGGKHRIPCSMYYQFLVRNNALDLIYTMRSNDFLTFFGSDNWFAISLLQYMSSWVGLTPGKYIYFCGSLHAYYKDLKVRGIF